MREKPATSAQHLVSVAPASREIYHNVVNRRLPPTPQELATTPADEPIITGPIITGPEFRRRRIAAGLGFSFAAQLLSIPEQTLSDIELGKSPMRYPGLWYCALLWLELDAANILRSYRALRKPIPWK
jgi:hypothetical protein